MRKCSNKETLTICTLLVGFCKHFALVACVQINTLVIFDISDALCHTVSVDKQWTCSVKAGVFMWGIIIIRSVLLSSMLYHISSVLVC